LHQGGSRDPIALLNNASLYRIVELLNYNPWHVYY
jgi:hypothetical protein